MPQDEIVVEAFHELAPRYEETVDRELKEYWGLSYTQFVDRLVALASVQRGEQVLDLATGTAAIPRRLVDRVGQDGRVVGLDITPAMLERGRESIEASTPSSRIRLVCASAMEIPFPDDSFDVVLCGLGTHHMHVPRMLFEVQRVLRTNGRMVMIDVGASAFWRSFLGALALRVLLVRYGLSRRDARAQAEVEAFRNVRTADEWKALLSKSGFSGIEVAESRALRPWYPSAVTMSAVSG
jgi:ubiquinone/menaquinone biosynthesis C-methylase UbiE